jgi:hypothetical protein
MMKKNVQVWLLLMAAVLVFLWSASARTAYATGGGVGTESFWPGEGGGLSNAVTGFIYHEGGGHVSGIWVFLETGYLTPLATTTNSEGFYKFEDPNSILPNSFYHISVNGEWRQLGVECIDKGYGQWYGTVQTDDKGVAWKSIWIERAAIVNVPAAALYSNTLYNQLMTYQSTSWHTLSFKSSVGSTGFLSSSSMTKSFLWGITGYNDSYIAKRYYAVGFYDETTSSLKSAGLSDQVDPYEDWRQYNVPEYLVPDPNKSNYDLPTDSTPEWFAIYGDSPTSFSYEETGSFTWSRGYSGSVGVNFLCFGVSVNIDTTSTVTSGYTNTVSFQVLLPPGAPTHKFLVYTRGFSFTDNDKGGLELHLWDLGVMT